MGDGVSWDETYWGLNHHKQLSFSHSFVVMFFMTLYYKLFENSPQKRDQRNDLNLN